MASVDPSTPVGKVRLRTGDWQTLPILPDAVIESALTDCNNDIPRASALCAQYILGMLTHKTHRRMVQLETWSGEQYDNYVKFIQMTILNPNFMSIAPVPYVGGNDEDHPLIEFVNAWNEIYAGVQPYDAAAPFVF